MREDIVPQATIDLSEIEQLVSDAKTIARRYYALTGKPLGVCGEVAEHEAAKKLQLKLSAAREPGFDAISATDGINKRIQIKGRVVEPSDRYRGRVPKIRLDPPCDAVVLVLLDRHTYETIEIWRAEYDQLKIRLTAPGSKARNERGSLGISQFKSIAIKVWPISRLQAL